METVLITGGTGLIGKYLCKKLQEEGYKVTILSRSGKTNSNTTFYHWDINKKEIATEAIKSADFIIHLAGDNIAAKRWTKKRKQQILSSRAGAASLLFEKVNQYDKQLKAFISASAIGFYGAVTSEKVFTENDPPGSDFLGQVCQKWEAAAQKFTSIGIRTVSIRTGLVLTASGGALSKMEKPVKMGVGSALGSGKQYLPWIHIEDLCNIYLKAIKDSQMTGAYNAVAPEYVNNKNFMSTLAKVLKKPFWAPAVPGFFIRIFLGRRADLLLKGSPVSCEKIKRAGYTFLFPKLNAALRNLKTAQL